MKLSDVIAIALVLALLVGLFAAGIWIALLVISTLGESWRT